MIKAYIVSGAVGRLSKRHLYPLSGTIARDYRKILGDSLTLMNMYLRGSLYSSALDSHYS